MTGFVVGIGIQIGESFHVEDEPHSFLSLHLFNLSHSTPEISEKNAAFHHDTSTCINTCISVDTAQTDKMSDLLYDTEGHGSGTFMPEVEDPEHCSANNTSLFELYVLRVSNFTLGMLDMLDIFWYI